MHIIMMVLAIFFYGVEKGNTPEVHTLTAPPGQTLVDCEAMGKQLKKQLEAKAEVRDAEFKCVEIIQGDKV